MLRRRFEGDRLIRGKQLVTMAALGAALASAALGGARILFAAEKSTIVVRNVDQLYAAVNDATNVGATVVLSPGVYVLSATEASGLAREHGGRLELQVDMSLRGLVGDTPSEAPGEVLFRTMAPSPSGLAGRAYDVAPDGRRFLLKLEAGSSPIHVILNWEARVRR